MDYAPNGIGRAIQGIRMHGGLGQDLRAGAAALLGSALLAACRAGGGPGEVQPSADCVLIVGEAPSEVNVGLTHAPNPANAPVPRNASERLIFRQLYETLIDVDCAGRVVPGLAESWSAEDGGRVWTFRIRDDATFWDGQPVSARDVAAAWAANANGSTHAEDAFARIRTQGERVLRVELQTPSPHPHLFAHPDLAVARRDADAAWPVGSGAFRVEPHAGQERLRVAATDPRRTTPRSIALQIAADQDPRRALDAGADVLVSSDAAVLRYARALPEYTVEPLMWSRTYVLATRTAPAGGERIALPPREAQLSLARDAVRADVRPAQSGPWDESSACQVDHAARPAPASASAPRDAIVYPRHDAIARGIAERLVALAWPPARAPAWLSALRPDTASDAPTALGLDDTALLEALRTGDAFAFVLPVSRATRDACAALTLADPALSQQRLSTSRWRIAPLLDARDHVIHRRGIGTITMDGDGAVRFAEGHE